MFDHDYLIVKFCNELQRKKRECKIWSRLATIVVKYKHRLTRFALYSLPIFTLILFVEELIHCVTNSSDTSIIALIKCLGTYIRKFLAHDSKTRCINQNKKYKSLNNNYTLFVET